MKQVKITSEYITLGQFIKFQGLISNGGEAKNFLASANVLVNGEEDNRRGRKLYPGYTVIINNKEFEIL